MAESSERIASELQVGFRRQPCSEAFRPRVLRNVDSKRVQAQSSHPPPPAQETPEADEDDLDSALGDDA